LTVAVAVAGCDDNGSGNNNSIGCSGGNSKKNFA